MHILLVDDDATVRKLVGIMLARQLPDIQITECETGLEALRALSTSREFALVMLDVNLPHFDGLQVLRAMRETPAHRHAPVLMLTGAPSEDVVKDAAALGVTDFIAKPLRPGEFGARIGRVIDKLAASPRPPHKRTTDSEPLHIDANTRVLIADGDPEFRRLFQKTVGKLCRVTEAASGLMALECCHTIPPYAVFVGGDLGIVNADLLVEQLRSTRQLDTIRVIGVLPPRLVLRTRKRCDYDAVIMRSFVPEVFMEGFTGLLRREPDAPELLQAIPDLKLLGIAACEEALTSLLRRPVELRPAQPQKATKRRYASGSVLMSIGDNRLPLGLSLGAPAAALSKLRQRVALPEPATRSGDDILVNLVTKISELLARELQNRGLGVAFESEAAEPARGSSTAVTAPASDLAAITFDVQGGGIAFRLDLQTFDSGLRLDGSGGNTPHPQPKAESSGPSHVAT